MDYPFVNIEAIKRRLVIQQTCVPKGCIYIHEKFVPERVDKLYEYVKVSGPSAILPSIIVCRHSSRLYMVVDGHHRFEVMKQLGYSNIPVTIIDYMNDSIVIHPEWKDNSVSVKMDIMAKSFKNEVMSPKSTKHMVVIKGSYIPIKNLSDCMYMTTNSSLNQRSTSKQLPFFLSLISLNLFAFILYPQRAS